MLLGDSITEGWEEPAASDAWNATFHGLPTHRIAIGGDRTQQLLWRIAHGALDGVDPQVVVLLAGVNNLWSMRQDNERVAQGLAAVLTAIQARLPRARLLHVGILPTQNPATHPIRRAAAAVNRRATAWATAQGVRFLDASAPFLGPAQEISPALMPDLCHLSADGYTRLARFLHQPIHDLLTP